MQTAAASSNDLDRESSAGSVSTPKKNFQNAISLFKNQEKGAVKDPPAPLFTKRSTTLVGLQNDNVIDRVASHGRIPGFSAPKDTERRF